MPLHAAKKRVGRFPETSTVAIKNEASQCKIAVESIKPWHTLVGHGLGWDAAAEEEKPVADELDVQVGIDEVNPTSSTIKDPSKTVISANLKPRVQKIHVPSFKREQKSRIVKNARAYDEFKKETIFEVQCRPGTRASRQKDAGEDEAKDCDFVHENMKKRVRRKIIPDINESSINKSPDRPGSCGDSPKKKRVPKNAAGLTPGHSPYEYHAKPTPDDCVEVLRLLTDFHRPELQRLTPPREDFDRPSNMPETSMEVTGCGEVPDVLDALLRTLLSAATTARNAAFAMAGLREKYGVRHYSDGMNKCTSINWAAVYESDVDTISHHIRRGGMGPKKARHIKNILDIVYQRNTTRRDALLAEKQKGKAADVIGAHHETQEQKDSELAKLSDFIFSMDHVFGMTSDEAMVELTKLPGIGVKTASCVILFCLRRPSFAVDTHVQRHCSWLGWIPEGKKDEKNTFQHCEVRIPNHLKYALHQAFLWHGKNCGRCRAITGIGTPEWEKTVCPIEHLVNRTGLRKAPCLKGIQKPATRNKRVKERPTEHRGIREDDIENEASKIDHPANDSKDEEI